MSETLCNWEALTHVSFFYPAFGVETRLQCQALLHEEMAELKRRRAELRQELRSAAKEDKKLRKRRANLVQVRFFAVGGFNVFLNPSMLKSLLQSCFDVCEATTIK